jgi:hypothetical protein
MTQLMSSIKKGGAGFVLLSFFFCFTALFLIPRFASAGFWDLLSPTALLATLITGVSYVINTVLSLFYTFASILVGMALDFNAGILGETNQLVAVGWSIARDVANLGFVIIIVIMAIATILRFETYGAKAVLPKLIAAAILVNFSLTIAGVFIKFTQILTDFFLQPTKTQEGVSAYFGFVTSVTTAFGPQRLFLTPPDPLPPDPSDQANWVEEFGTATLTSIANMIFSAVFILIATLVMFGFFLMLLARYLHLTFLMIISPIVWLFWVIPDLSGQFKTWWNSFLKWTFFAPAVSFFLYLALRSAEQLSKTGLPASTSHDLGGLGGAMHSIMSQGAQMIVLAGIMLGGLIIGQNMGVAGAQMAVGAAKGIGKGIGKWAGSKALRGGQEAIRGAARFALNPKDTYKSWREGIKNRWTDFKTRPFKVKERLEKAKEKTKEGLGKLATMKPIETPSLASSLFNEVGKATGLWSAKEKKPAKTIADLEKELEGKEKQKDALMRLHLDTTEIDQDIRDIESKIQSIKDAKLRADLVLMDKDEFERNLQEAEKKLKDLENERETGGAEARTPAKEREYRAARREYELMKKEEKFRKERGGTTSSTDDSTGGGLITKNIEEEFKKAKKK